MHPLSHLLGLHRTVVRARLAQAIRWVSPSFFMGGLLTLQVQAEGMVWLLWLVVLAAAAVTLCYLGAWKQWRPFLFTGLIYVAVTFGRAFFEDEGDGLLFALAGSCVTLGLLPPNRQAVSVTNTSVASYIAQAGYILRNLATKPAFDNILTVNNLAQPADFIFG